MSVATVTAIRHPGPIDQYGENTFVWYDECEQVAGAASTFEAAYHQRRAYAASLSEPRDDRAELFDFLMTAATDPDLGAWVDFMASQMTSEPKNLEEATATSRDLLTRAKAAGVYPIKA
jgi:hypothetical protein